MEEEEKEKEMNPPLNLDDTNNKKFPFLFSDFNEEKDLARLDINKEIKVDLLDKLKIGLNIDKETKVDLLHNLKIGLTDYLEFNASDLLLNQGIKRFLMYQENLLRIPESNVEIIEGIISKILPKQVDLVFFILIIRKKEFL